MVVFVVGTGRCGTKWLAEMLGASKIAVVRHEPYGDELLEMNLKKETYIPSCLRSHRHYVECNGYMTKYIETLRGMYDAEIYSLVRDGRDVVRSFYNRHLFKDGTREQEYQPQGETRFEKLCWWWNDQNRKAMSHGVPMIKFEDLLKDWGYFNLTFGFLEIPQTVWDRKRRSKVNAAKRHNLPHHSKWGAEQTMIFDKHCGSLMRGLGYK